MATNDPAALETLIKRIGEQINRIATVMSGKMQQSLDKMQKASVLLARANEVQLKAHAALGKLFERNRNTAEEIAAIEKNLATVIYPAHLRNAETLGREMENVQKQAKLVGLTLALEQEGKQMQELAKNAVLLDQALANANKGNNLSGLDAALKSGKLQPMLADAAVQDQRGDNLSREKKVVGLEGAMKSGQLQPLIKEAAELEKRAKAVEKAISWERLKAEKGVIGAHFDNIKGKLASIGEKASSVFSGMTRAMGSTLNSMKSGFSSLKSSLADTVQLASPAAFIHFDYAVKDLSGSIGHVLMPTLVELTRGIRHVADVVISMPEPMQRVVNAFAKFGLVATSVGGAAVLLAPLFTAIATGVGTLITAGTTLATVFGGPVAAALAIPLAPLAAIGGALALAAGAWVAYKTGLLDTLGEFEPLRGIVNALKNAVEQMEGMFAGVVPLIARIGAIGIRAFEGILSLLKPIVQVTNTLITAFTPVADFMLKLGGAILGRVVGIVERLSATMSEMGEKLKSKLGPFIQSIMPALNSIGTSLVQMFDAVQPAIDAVIEAGKVLFDLFLKYGLPAISASISGTAKAIQALVPIFKMVASQIKMVIDNVVAQFKAVEQYFQGFINTYEKLRAGLEKAGVNLPKLEWAGFGGSGESSQFGAEFDKNTNSITDAINKMIEALKNPKDTSINAAVRPAQFTSIAEFGRQATLSAFSMSDKETAEERAERQRREQIALAQEQRDSLVIIANNAIENAATAAINRG